MTLTRLSALPWSRPAPSLNTVQDGWVAPNNAYLTGNAWGTANRAIYVPIRVPSRVMVRQLAVGQGSTSTGNIDIGLYDATGTRLASTGSQTKLSSVLQVHDVTDTIIGPGLYYLAVNNDTTTDTILSATVAAVVVAGFGILTQAVGAVTLPSTATWAVDNALAFIPNISALLVTEIS